MPREDSVERVVSAVRVVPDVREDSVVRLVVVAGLAVSVVRVVEAGLAVSGARVAVVGRTVSAVREEPAFECGSKSLRQIETMRYYDP